MVFASSYFQHSYLDSQHGRQPVFNLCRRLTLLPTQKQLINNHLLMRLLRRNHKRKPGGGLLSRITACHGHPPGLLRPGETSLHRIGKRLDPAEQHLATAAPDEDMTQRARGDLRPPLGWRRRGLRVEVVPGPLRDVGPCRPG